MLSQTCVHAHARFVLHSVVAGITVCGSGIGTFVFAPLTEYLLGQLDWKGAMVIVAGIVLHGAIAGALFRPLQKSTFEAPWRSSEIFLEKQAGCGWGIVTIRLCIQTTST